MSNKLNDVNAVHVVSGLVSPTISATDITAAGVDLATADYVFAIQVAGTLAGTTATFRGKLQEATTATGTYTDISGATFTTITSTTGAAGVQLLNFQRTQRFVRYVGDIAGTTDTTTTLSIALAVLLCGQKKQL